MPLASRGQKAGVLLHILPYVNRTGPTAKDFLDPNINRSEFETSLSAGISPPTINPETFSSPTSSLKLPQAPLVQQGLSFLKSYPTWHLPTPTN